MMPSQKTGIETKSEGSDWMTARSQREPREGRERPTSTTASDPAASEGERGEPQRRAAGWPEMIALTGTPACDRIAEIARQEIAERVQVLQRSGPSDP